MTVTVWIESTGRGSRVAVEFCLSNSRSSRDSSRASFFLIDYGPYPVGRSSGGFSRNDGRGVLVDILRGYTTHSQQLSAKCSSHIRFILSSHRATAAGETIPRRFAGRRLVITHQSLVLQRLTSLALVQVNILATLFSSVARISCCNTPPQLWRAYVSMIVACLVTPPYTIYTMGGIMKELQDLAKRQTSNNEKHERNLVARFGRLHLPRALWLSAALVILAYNTIASR